MCGGVGFGAGGGVGKGKVTGRMARMITVNMLVADWSVIDGAGIIIVSVARVCRVSDDKNR